MKPFTVPSWHKFIFSLYSVCLTQVFTCPPDINSSNQNVIFIKPQGQSSLFDYIKIWHLNRRPWLTVIPSFVNYYTYYLIGKENGGGGDPLPHSPLASFEFLDHINNHDNHELSYVKKFKLEGVPYYKDCQFCSKMQDNNFEFL